MQEFNELPFDPNTLKKNLEQNLGANITITTTGENKQDKRNKDDFFEFVMNMEIVLVNQQILEEDFGINLNSFLEPIHQANLFLMQKQYGELGKELILQFIENRDVINREQPLVFVENNVRYEICDIEDLYFNIKMLKENSNLIQNGRKKRTK